MDLAAPIVTRFAPSPNGHLHLGHAFSAIIAHDIAKASSGRFLLRIEDIDGPRSLPDLPDQFRRDLEWLGLEWEEVPPQSTRLESYRQAAQRLEAQGLAYRCTCTRQEIADLQPRTDAKGNEYPGSCKGRCPSNRGGPAALRLDIDKAIEACGDLTWHDEQVGWQTADPLPFGDVVIVRKELPASYHLAATLDDAADGVTLVTRGLDLFASTHIHRLLQALLGLPVPVWHHHKLILDEEGQKLAKRKGSSPLFERRQSGEDGIALAQELRSGQFRTGT